MVYLWTFIGRSTSDFICSLSEALKGAEDKGQIKAPLGGMPATGITIFLNIETLRRAQL